MSNQLLASKVALSEEQPQIRTIAGVATSVLGIVGVTEKGPIAEATLVTSPEEYRALFGGYVANGSVAQAIAGFFENGGSTAWISRVVHFADPADPTTKASTAATKVLTTSALAASAAAVLAGNAGPYVFTTGVTLRVLIDALGVAIATFTAAAAVRDSAVGPFTLADGETLELEINGVALPTVTFVAGSFVDITNATAAEVAAVLAAVLTGVALSVSGGKVRLTTDRKGTGASIEVTGGSANVGLAFSTALIAGTGNVADIGAVTASEVQSILATALGATAVVSLVLGAPKITSATTGASSMVQVEAASTADVIVGFDNAVHNGLANGTQDTLQVDAKYDGAYGNALKAGIAAASSGKASEFNFQVYVGSVVVETFPNVTMDDTAANFVETVVNHAQRGSKYVTVTDLDAAAPSPDDRPATGVSGLLTGGADGLGALADTDFIGNAGENGRTGLRALDLVQDLSLLIVPGRATSAVHNAMVAYCEVLRNMQAFAILDPPAAQSAVGIVDYVENTAALIELSEFAAIYWPQVKVLNPNKAVFGNEENIIVPPSGHIAGVYARTDSATPGGVYVPPAGIDTGKLLGVVGFEHTDTLDETKRDLVYPKRVNPLTVIPGAPRHIDGVYTLKASGNFPTIAERRGAIFIEQSVKAGLQPARHRNNDETLRSEVTRTVDAFLLRQMKVRAFRTMDPATAYYVDFGDGLNGPAVQFANQLRGRVGIATQKPAEFIVVSFAQDTRAFDQQQAG